MACSDTSRTSSCRICEGRGRCRTTNRHSKINLHYLAIAERKNQKYSVDQKYCVDRGSGPPRSERKSHFCAASDATRSLPGDTYLCVLWCVLWRRLKVRRGLTCVKCGIRRFRALPTSGCCRGASRGGRPRRRSLRQRHTRGAFCGFRPHFSKPPCQGRSGLYWHF